MPDVDMITAETSRTQNRAPLETEVFDMKKIVKALLAILGLAAAAYVLDSALTVWAWRTRNPRLLRFVKRSHKHVLNPVMLQLSGRFGSSAVIHHVGRRSGTPYATPVVAHQANHDVIIPLPYGTEVDWLRNLLAAGLEGDMLTTTLVGLRRIVKHQPVNTVALRREIANQIIEKEAWPF